MKSEINKAIGQRIKAHYTEGGGKQSALKKIIDAKHNSTISNILNGDRTLRPDELAKISENMGVTLDWLITGHEAIHTGKMFFNDDSPCVSDNLGYYPREKLSDDERQLLNLFRKLDTREYGGAMRALELIVETSKYPLKEK